MRTSPKIGSAVFVTIPGEIAKVDMLFFITDYEEVQIIDTVFFATISRRDRTVYVPVVLLFRDR